MEFPHFFRSEVQEWWYLFLEHRVRHVLFLTVLVFLLVLFQLSVRGYQFLQSTLEFVTSEVDIVLDLKDGVRREDVSGVESYLGQKEGVVSIEYSSSDEVMRFVDRDVVPGYKAFVEESHVPVSFSPFLRISVANVELLSGLREDLIVRFPEVFLGTGGSEVDGQVVSLADQLLLLSQRFSSVAFLMVFFTGIAFLFLYVSFLSFFLLSRKKEFHLVSILGLAHHLHRYSFWGVSAVFGLICFLFLLIVVLFLGMVEWILIFEFLMILIFGCVVAEVVYRY